MSQIWNQVVNKVCYQVHYQVWLQGAVRWTPKKRQPLKVIFLDTGKLSFSGGFPYAATKA